MNKIIAYADANGVIGFAQACPTHGLGFARGHRQIVEAVVTELAEKLDGSLVIPNFGPTANNIESLIAFGAKVRAALAKAETTHPSAQERFDAARQHAAQEAFEAYDFPAEVNNTTGWERTTPGDEWRRHVFLEGETPDAPSILGAFTVTFTKATASIADISFSTR